MRTLEAGSAQIGLRLGYRKFNFEILLPSRETNTATCKDILIIIIIIEFNLMFKI